MLNEFAKTAKSLSVRARSTLFVLIHDTSNDKAERERGVAIVDGRGRSGNVLNVYGALEVEHAFEY